MNRSIPVWFDLNRIGEAVIALNTAVTCQRILEDHDILLDEIDIVCQFIGSVNRSILKQLEKASLKDP